MSSKPVVMLVVDDAMTREGLKHDLEVLDLDVLSAPNTEVGWGLLLKGPTPDVVLLDFFLPGRDGPDFLDQIRSDSRLKTLSVILCPIVIGFNGCPDPSKDSLFVPIGNTKTRQIQPNVSRNGKQKTNGIPPELIFFIASSFHKKDIEIPLPFAAEMERCSEILFQNLSTDEEKKNG